MIGNTENTVIPDARLNYTEVTEEFLTSIISEVNTFLDLVFSLNAELNFTKHFGVNPANLDTYKGILKEDLMQHLKPGLAMKKKELGGIQILMSKNRFSFIL